MKPLNVATPATAAAEDPAVIVPVPFVMVAVTVAVDVVELPEASAIRMTG